MQQEQPLPDDQHPSELPQLDEPAAQPDTLQQELQDEPEDEREPKLYVDVNVANFGL
jgi:hypothetical protein